MSEDVYVSDQRHLDKVDMRDYTMRIYNTLHLLSLEAWIERFLLADRPMPEKWFTSPNAHNLFRISTQEQGDALKKYLEARLDKLNKLVRSSVINFSDADNTTKREIEDYLANAANATAEPVTDILSEVIRQKDNIIADLRTDILRLQTQLKPFISGTGAEEEEEAKLPVPLPELPQPKITFTELLNQPVDVTPPPTPPTFSDEFGVGYIGEEDVEYPPEESSTLQQGGITPFTFGGDIFTTTSQFGGFEPSVPGMFNIPEASEPATFSIPESSEPPVFTMPESLGFGQETGKTEELIPFYSEYTSSSQMALAREEKPFWERRGE